MSACDQTAYVPRARARLIFLGLLGGEGKLRFANARALLQDKSSVATLERHIEAVYLSGSQGVTASDLGSSADDSLSFNGKKVRASCGREVLEVLLVFY